MARRIRPSLLLDTAPSSRAAASGGGGVAAAPAAPAVSWVYGEVTATPSTDSSLPVGWVEVGIPAGTPVTHALGQSDGIATWVGARVMVILDATGRVLKISDPVYEPPEGADIEYTGQAGKKLKKALDDATEAQRSADAVRDRARDAENKALAASQAAAKALAVGEANRPPYVGPTAPEKPVKGMIWYTTRADGAITAASVWDGTTWLPRPLVASTVLVPGSVGDVSLADGAVTAPKIYASKELSAKVGAFLEVTTDMLTAGNATIPGTAVVGDLIGNHLIGGEISLLDASGDQQQTEEFDSPTGHGWHGIASPTTTTVAVADGAMTVTVTKAPPAGVTATALARHNGPFGPTGTGMSAITVTAVMTPSWDGRISLFAHLEDGTWYVGRADGKAGTRTTITLTVPEGHYIATDPTFHLEASGVVPAGSTLVIESVTATWRPLRVSGLRIYRDQTGSANIRVTGQDGSVTTLGTTGVGHTPAGATTPSTTTWRAFTDPPLASTWHTRANVKAAHDKWTKVPFRGGSVTLKGGIVAVGDEFIVPMPGFYRLTASMVIRGADPYAGGAAVSVNGQVSAGVFGLHRLASGQWTTLGVSRIRKLNAGDKLMLWVYQNFGSVQTVNEGGMTVEWFAD